MLDLAMLIGGAALPSAVLIALFYRADRARPEPLGLVWRSVLYGFLSAVPAVGLEYLVGLPSSLMPGVLKAAWTAFVTAATVEEGVKYLFLRRSLLRNAAFDEILDGIVYAVSVSLGFAFAENIAYGLGGESVLVLRAFTAVPMHAAATGIMGYRLGLSKQAGTASGAAAERRRGVALAVLIHGFYDFFLFLGSFWSVGAMAVLVASLVEVRRLVVKARAMDDTRAALRGY